MCKCIADMKSKKCKQRVLPNNTGAQLEQPSAVTPSTSTPPTDRPSSQQDPDDILLPPSSRPPRKPARAVLGDMKHGKARMYEDEPSMAQVQQYVLMRHTPTSHPRSGSCENSTFRADDDDGPRSSKRRRLSTERHEDVLEDAEDVRMLNKAYRAAEEALNVKDAEIASLRQELILAKSNYERKESELRQDLLFRHIIAREQAARDHEKEKISLHRLVSFLKGNHEKHVETLEEEHCAALAKEQARTQDALAQAMKQKQLVQQRETAAFMQIQHMHAVTEHANALSKTYEGDLMELQRINIEEAEERERDNLGLPPAYDSLPDIKGYRIPYGAIRHQDAGDLGLDNIEATITKDFMRELQAANRDSLILREHPCRAKAAGAGSLLYHKAMLAYARACQHLRGLLEHAIQKRAEANALQSTIQCIPSSGRLPSLLSAAPTTSRSKTPAKLPSLSDLGLPMSATKGVQTNEAPVCDHPIDLFMRLDRSSHDKTISVAQLAHADATIATTDRISHTMYELCTHIFAALDVREHCSEKLCHNRCARLGTWLRLADDTLLHCLKRRLGATIVEELQPQIFGATLSCAKCASEHCGGYCLRLQMLSYNINKLKAIRRGFDKISSPTRAGMYFTDTWHWLKDTLENERQISANILLPPTRQPTPEMTEEEMTLAIQHSALDPATAAAQQAIRRQSSEADLARRLQAIRDQHFPPPRPSAVSQAARPQHTLVPLVSDIAPAAAAIDVIVARIQAATASTTDSRTMQDVLLSDVEDERPLRAE